MVNPKQTYVRSGSDIVACRRNVLALSFVALLNDASSEIVYPLLPAFLALSLGASPFAIGLIEGFAESVASLLKLVSGYLSDRFGTRKLPVFRVIRSRRSCGLF